MQLECLKDVCPETGEFVDMLRCCGAHAWSKPCKYYGKEPWSEYIYATCEHPSAWSQNQDLQDRHVVMLEPDQQSLSQGDRFGKAKGFTFYTTVLAELADTVWTEN